MELEILACGHVRDSIRIFLGQLRHHFELLRIQSTCGNLDALHSWRIPKGVRSFGQIARREIELLDLLPIVTLAIVVALAVGPATKTRFSKQALFELALFAQRDLGFEDVDLASESIGHLPVEFFFPARV